MTNTVSFDQYEAKDLTRGKGSLLGNTYWYLKSKLLYGHVLYPYGVIKHAQLLATCDRTQSHTYTCFLRTPAQLQAVVGPVLKFLGGPNLRRQLRILVLACSNGAEAYTLASYLKQHVPNLDFRITAADLHDEMVERGRTASYSAQEALQSEFIDTEFVNRTFDVVGDRYFVKEEVRKHVTFTQANLLDDTLPQRLDAADIVTAQNVLFHLQPHDARAAFRNIVALLRPYSALLIDGMDLPLRVELTRAYKLKPLRYNAKKIYEQGRVHTPLDWWRYYWGTEPYSRLRADRARRYGTIFLNKKTL